MEILFHNNPHKPFTLEADATHFPRASLLLQTKDNGQLHLLDFLSQKFESVLNTIKLYSPRFSIEKLFLSNRSPLASRYCKSLEKTFLKYNVLLYNVKEIINCTL